MGRKSINKLNEVKHLASFSQPVTDLVLNKNNIETNKNIYSDITPLDLNIDSMLDLISNSVNEKKFVNEFINLVHNKFEEEQNHYYFFLD